MNPSEKMTLGSLLKIMMTAKHMTERDVARGAGIAQSGLSSLVHEKACEPDPCTLRAIADFLGIDVYILFRLLNYVPPSTEPYGAYAPLALYMDTVFKNSLQNTNPRFYTSSKPCTTMWA